MGSPFGPQPGSKAALNPPASGPNIGGSMMIYVMDTFEEVWARLKEDPYWTAGVWDRERMRVEPLLS